MRCTWIDSWRGGLIFLVVMGHAFGAAYHFTDQSAKTLCELGYKIIYSFHMPAFFFLSGWLWSIGQSDFFNYMLKKTRRLIVPYFLWGGLSILIFYLVNVLFPSLFSGAITSAYSRKPWPRMSLMLLSLLHGGGWPNGQGLIYNAVLWFLPAMFTLEILFFLINKVIRNETGIMVVSLFSMSFWFFLRETIANLPFGFENALRFLPYFVVGQLVRIRYGLPPLVLSKLRVFFIGFTLFAVFITACIVTPNRIIIFHSFAWHLVFFAMALLGTVASGLVAVSFDCRLLQFFGQSSLLIMVVHKFVFIGIFNGLPVAKSMKTFGPISVVLTVVAISLVTIFLSAGLYPLLRRYCPIFLGENHANR